MSIRIGIGLDVFGAGIDANAQTIYNRIIADGGVSNLTRLNFFVKGLKAIYGDLANVPVCYDAHWIGYKLGSGTGATAGQAAAKLYSLTVAGDAIQATAASQPLLLAHNGASTDNYWYGSGVAGNRLSSNVTYASNNTEIEAVFSLNITTGSNIVVGGNGTNDAFFFYYDYSVNAIALTFNANSGFRVSYAVTSFTNLDTFYVLRNATTGAITFKKNGTTLTTVGYQVAGNLDYSITQVKVGEGNCKVNRAKLFIAGITVIDCNPAQYNASTSQTQWTSSTGEVWTISTGTATTGYKGVLVDRTIVQSDGVDDTLVMPSNVGLTAPVTLYTSFRGYSDDGGTGKSIFGYSNIDVAITRFNLSNIVAWFGNGGLSNKQFTLAGISDKTLLAMAIRRNGTCELSINNATPVTGTQATAIVDGKIGVSVSGFSNATFRTGVVISGADNSTNQTSMYNLIRSLNNNAF